MAPFQVLDASGVLYAHPFLGGLDVPRPQLLDADGDGDLDLFVQERTNQLGFFENTGTPAESRFVWRSDQWLGLEVGEWNRFFDMDGDGDLDLFGEAPFSYMRYWRNDGTPAEPRFVVAADTVRTPDGEPIFSDRQNIPNLTDIDCDGRVDLFLGRVDGTVARFEEAAASTDEVPVFELVNPRFEGIEIVAAIAVPGNVPEPDGDESWPVELSPSAPVPAGPASLAPTLHGANAMAFADLDRDGDQDFFWGDFFEPGLLWIENLGSCAAPDLRSEPVPVPAEELIATSGYNVSALADLDADGDTDLVLGVLGGAFNPNTTAADNLHYYEQDDAGRFVERTTRLLDGLDFGSESDPAFGDLDGDGDLDLLVGSKLDPTVLTRARLYHLENVGSATAPAYQLVDTLDAVESFHLSPELADLDGDGDLDVVLGTWNQDVRYMENVGTPQTPRFQLHQGEPLADLPRGSHATPALGDVDGDGDLDLAVGESSGEVNLFMNTGTATAPRFQLVTEELAGIDVGRRSVPAFVDVEGDGDADLVVGSEDGGGAVFLNAGFRVEAVASGDPGQGASGTTSAAQPGTPVFTPGGTLDGAFPPYSAPVFLDVDGDGDLDVVSGAMAGGLVFLRNDRNRR